MNTKGQSTVEYLLVISVVVIALIAAGYSFLPSFKSGYKAMSNDTKTVIASGTRDGSGDQR